ncbi:PAS domain-containing methyl-accepting chemotaxis protein [Vibrio hannami]|uniref:methyl-accepting chemotaxis protein n=1 Tax=Vibrio hannami TaxID=2717094 RepID=UPI00240F31F3|nr:PAS domain-containing methyl-accepting chemotaxis protein [Vibrio hannami]MDG3087519.1 PAS domain-containing methyl-accepting chemotaxis protein [Vibrio hannami]
MRNNQPVTQKEQKFRTPEDLVSVTDLDGKIKYVNGAFLEISGFTEEELIGADHNIVRHPDMPKAAFEDLWSTVRSGIGWKGIVKNRCKNGDHYWVSAFVTPVLKGGQVVGYQSVRSEPTRQQVADAEKLYAKLRQNESLKLPKPPLHKRISLKATFLTTTAVSLLSLLLVLISNLNQSNLFSVSMIVIAMLSVVFTCWKFLSHVLAPIDEVRFFMRDMAGGDYTQPINSDREDEVGRTIMAVKLLQARSKTILGQVIESTQDLIVSVDHLSASSHEMLGHMKSQASTTTQVATAMTEMSATVEEVSGNAQQSSDTTNSAQSTVTDGDAVVTDALQSMQVFSEELTKTTEQINQLSADSEQISQITDVISGIADQTNLLALNAAIEAARAGEAGRGFAVVADEVRGLASRTQEATQEIRTMLDNLSSGIQHSASTIESNNEEAQQALEKVASSREIFAQVAESMNHINDMSMQIATAAEEQALVAHEMSRNIENISDHATETENEAEMLQVKVTKMNENALHLQAQLSDFDLGNSNGK